VETLERIRLEPVLELEPGHYSQRERRSPTKSWNEVPDEWERYWRDSLADSGLVGLVNLRRGGWQVPVRTLDCEDVLATIMRVELKDQEPLSLDNCPLLSGGLALVEGDRPVIEPQCCGDLANVDMWKDAAGHTDPSWQRYWIGHPQLPVRFIDGWLELATPSDEGTPEPSWRVSPSMLKDAVGEARAELERFAPRVLQVLRRWPARERIDELARSLAGLGDR
jgi:hypothetical protein